MFKIMKSKKFLFVVIACAAFFGTFFVTNDTKAACVNPEKCCKCFKEIIGDDPYMIFEGADLDSANTCNNECSVKYPAAAFYIYGGSDFIRITKRSTNSVTNTPGPAISSPLIPGAPGPESELIKCGRPGQNMCTLCDLIAGMNNIIKYLMKIAVGVALLAITIGGVMYIISASDSGLVDTAKSTIKNAAIGFALIFAAYLIVNTTISYIGARTNDAGQSTFGMKITSWGAFDCTENTDR
jgi:hypothetical protein